MRFCPDVSAAWAEAHPTGCCCRETLSGAQANRMEDALEAYANLSYMEERRIELKKEIKDLKKEKHKISLGFAKEKLDEQK